MSAETQRQERPGPVLERIGGRDVWWHSGAISGYFTHIAVVPERARALVFVANRYGELEADEFAALARHLTLRAAGNDAVLPDIGGASLIAVIVLLAAGVAVLLAGAMTLSGRRDSPRAELIRAAPIAAACALVVAGVAAGMWGSGIGYRVVSRWAPDVPVVAVVCAGGATVVGTLAARRTRAALRARRRAR